VTASRPCREQEASRAGPAGIREATRSRDGGASPRLSHRDESRTRARARCGYPGERTRRMRTSRSRMREGPGMPGWTVCLPYPRVLPCPPAPGSIAAKKSSGGMPVAAAACALLIAVCRLTSGAPSIRRTSLSTPDSSTSYRKTQPSGVGPIAAPIGCSSLPEACIAADALDKLAVRPERLAPRIDLEDPGRREQGARSFKAHRRDFLASSSVRRRPQIGR